MLRSSIKSCLEHQRSQSLGRNAIQKQRPLNALLECLVLHGNPPLGRNMAVPHSREDPERNPFVMARMIW